MTKQNRLIRDYFTADKDCCLNFKLPLSVVERLVELCLEGVVMFNEMYIYYGQSGGTEMNTAIYGNTVLSCLIDEFDRHQLSGIEFVDGVIDRKFKNRIERLKAFQKSHKSQAIGSNFKPCNRLCCRQKNGVANSEIPF